MKYYAIIVGGGSGKRMQNVIAKQFLLLKDKPILMHSISAFFNSKYLPEIIVVLPADTHEYWKNLCITYNFNIPHLLVSGGKQRFHSVNNGLMAIDGEGYVAVHDAVRPLVSRKLINSGYEIATERGNAIAFIKPSDSIRQLTLEGSTILNREEIMLIQTPQTFEISQLRKAYLQAYNTNFTDDASVVEKAGFKINLIAGERFNLKITFPEDLALASHLIKEL